MSWRRAIVCLLVPLLASACGPLPRPFQAPEANPLLDDTRAMQALSVQTVEGWPGLAEDLAAALRDEDMIAVTTEDKSPVGPVSRIAGTLEGESLRLQIQGPDGQSLGEGQVVLAQGSRNDGAVRQRAAHAAAEAIARLLRGDDSGVSDVASRPRVVVRLVQAQPSIDSHGLTAAMRQSLIRQGLAVVETDPLAVVEGVLRVTPQGATMAVVDIEWTVRDSTGNELGVVSQGSPVDRSQVLGNFGSLGREIAEAGSEGVAEVVRKQAIAR